MLKLKSICAALLCCSLNAVAMHVSDVVDETAPPRTTGWQVLIKAARDGDYARVRELIVDYYYPIFFIREFDELPEKQQFLGALTATGLFERTQIGLAKMVTDGLTKDVAKLRIIGERLHHYQSDFNEAIAAHNFIIFPDLHGEADLEISIMATILRSYREGDVVLVEGAPDSEIVATSDEKHVDWLSAKAIRILASEKAKAIVGSYSAFEDLAMFNALGQLLLDRDALVEYPFEIRDNVLHLKDLPYCPIRTTGWDIDLTAKLHEFHTHGKDIFSNTIAERNPSLIKTSAKYLGRADGRVFLIAGAGHIPETALQMRFARKNAIASGNFDDGEKTGLLNNFDLDVLPSSLNEALANESTWLSDMAALRETHDYLKATPHVVIISPEFVKSLAELSMLDVIKVKSQFDEAQKNPRIFKKLFEVAEKGDYAAIEELFRGFYYPFFHGDKSAFDDEIAAFSFLLDKHSLFRKFESDLPEWVARGINADLKFIKKVTAEINGDGYRFGLDMQRIFETFNIIKSPRQSTKIHFLPHDSKNYRESLANFVLINQHAGPRDAIIVEQPVKNGFPFEDIAGESLLVLRTLAAKKCEQLRMHCNEEDMDFLVHKLFACMSTVTRKGRPLMTRTAATPYFQFVDLPKVRRTTGSFGGPVNANDFARHNEQLLQLLQIVIDAGCANIWILTSPERIPSYALMRRNILQEVVAEEGFDVTRHPAIALQLSLDDIYTKNTLDPQDLWCPLLPHDFCRRLGSNNYRMVTQATLRNRIKEEIRTKVRAWRETLHEGEPQ